MNEEVNYYEKYEGVYVTTSANVNTIPITLDNTTYRSDLDLLDVYVNGLYLDKNKYSINNSNIILNEELHIVGTKLQFKVLRSVVTSVPFSSLKGDPGNTTTIKRWEES